MHKQSTASDDVRSTMYDVQDVRTADEIMDRARSGGLFGIIQVLQSAAKVASLIQATRVKQLTDKPNHKQLIASLSFALRDFDKTWTDLKPIDQQTARPFIVQITGSICHASDLIKTAPKTPSS